MRLKALTWDHPRGYNALAAAAGRLDPTRDGLAIDWERQPLEGFESHPIADICARYDLVVLDHPHLGEALAADCLQPLDALIGAEMLAELSAASIGPSLESYRMDGRLWALPLDAAAQVMALRRDLVPDPPATWDEVAEIAEVTGRVALSWAGPHAILSLLSICTALGEEPGRDPGGALVSEAVGLPALTLLQRLARAQTHAARGQNPIAILERMAAGDDIALVPLVFGYVTYASPGRARPITFRDAPTAAPGGRPGSVLGGTGIALSRRCQPSAPLIAHLRWLMGADAQLRFIPEHDGQPSRRAAWHDEGVNARSGGFYGDTARTLEAAYVRPRFDGFIAFQTEASAVLRAAMQARRDAGSLLAQLDAMFTAHRDASRRAGRAQAAPSD